MPRVEFSASADADLRELYDYIAADAGKERALGYVTRVTTRVAAVLETFERSGSWYSRSRGLRMISVEKRVVFLYRVQPDRVVTLRVLYAGRQP